jgi:hypothetical protein
VSTEPDYIISARLDITEGSNAGGDLASRRLRGVESEAQRVGTSISGILTRAFAVLGGVTGIGLAVKGIIGLNSEIQTTRNGLATLFNAMTGMPIASTIGIARRELRLLQQDAARGVGELSDYTQAYQMILSPSLGAGKNLDQIRGLVRNSLAAGAAMRGNEGLRLMPMDLVQAMSGQVGLRTTPMIAQALAAAGITLETFRKADAPKQFDLLNQAFERFGPGVALMGKSWDAQFSTLRDNTKQIIRDVSSPLFDVWTKGLIRVNSWMEANRSVIASITPEWGGRMVALWDKLIAQAGTYAAIVGGATLAPTALAAGGAVAAAGGRAAAAVSPAISAAAWGFLGGTGGGIGRSGSLLGGLRGAAAGAMGALPGLGAAAAPLGIVTGLLTSLFVAIKNGGPGIDLAKRGIESLMSAFSSLGVAFGVLTTRGGALDGIGQALAATLGTLADVAGPMVRIFSSLVTVIGTVLNVIVDGLKAIYFVTTGQIGEASKIDVSGRMSEMTDALAAIWYPNSQGKRFAATGPDGTAKLPMGKVPKAQDVHIGTVNMVVKTEMNADPTRVIHALKEGLDNLGKYTRQGRRLPTLAGY